MNEHLLFPAVAVLVCLPLSLALAAAGLPLTSAVLLFNPPKRVKVFRDKYGQQTATFCLLAGLASLLCMGGGGAFIWSRYPAASSFWLGWPLPLAPLAGAAALAVALACVYRAVWQGMRDNRGAHAAIGVGATVSGWALGYLFVTFLRHFVVTPVEPQADPALFLPPLDSAAWFMLPAALALSLAFAGSTASLYLIARRDKDDFGRDYYNYTLKLASKWALFPTLAALAACGAHFATLWPAVRNLPLRPFYFWSSAGGLVCFLMACTLWALVMKNQNPLRLKLHCVAAYALAVAGFSGVMAAWAKFYFG